MSYVKLTSDAAGCWRIIIDEIDYNVFVLNVGMFCRRSGQISVRDLYKTHIFQNFANDMSKRKAPSSNNNVNYDFCDFLTGMWYSIYLRFNLFSKSLLFAELADYEKNVNRNIYKHNAYRKAASVLAAHPLRISSGKEAQALNGVGDKIAKKIDEFLQTGKLRKLENVSKIGSKI